MNQDDRGQEPDAAPAGQAPLGRRRTVPFLPMLLLAAVALLAVAGGLSWRAQGGRVAELEQALAAATAERDAASAGAEQRQAVLDQAEAEREALDARRLELERQLTAAREELARLRAELASVGTLSRAARQEPATARAEAVAPPAEEARSAAPAPEPAPPTAAVAGTAGPATGGAAAVPSAPPATGGERAAGEPGVEALEERLASAAAGEPAGPESGSAVGGQEPAEAEAVAAPEPAAGPVTGAESLTVTFDVNSSYLPANLDGRLRRLAEGLERGQRYEVQLTASVGAGPVANAGDAGAAARYNRWLAERRLDRVAAFLRENAGAGAEALAIERDLAADDPSRRVVVQVRPVP